MSVVDHVVQHVSLTVVRSAMDIGARQASTILGGTVANSLTSATAIATAITTSQTQTPPVVVSPSLSASATDPQSTTDSPGGDGTDNGGTNSPLLFFVALGFGVVFTNLWIIVGVKYCFRYNARTRAMRGGTDGEPISMENMARPRRRREKRLMTIEEVNDKFPMMKYKSWVSARALEGLPTTGGVSVPPSRANSTRSLGAASPDLTSKERISTDELPTSKPSEPDDQGDSGTDQETSREPRIEAPPTTNTKGNEEGQPSQQQQPAPAPAPAAVSSTNPGILDPQHPARAQNDNNEEDDDDDDDDHMTAITAALPHELYGTSGDTCAICIDTLEDDDDVRGLTCGHVFHAVCVDPWLLSRRACCPLCKADYYTPKPGAQTHQNTNTLASQAALQRRRSSLLFRAQHGRSNPRSISTDTPHASTLTRLRSVFQMPLRAGGAGGAGAPPPSRAPPTRTRSAPARAAFRWPSLPFRRPRQPGAPSETAQNSPTYSSQSPNPAATAPTPSQLEAGTRYM